MSLTKIELANLLYESMHVDKKQAEELVDLFFEELKKGLLKDGELKLSGFGNFQIKQKTKRRGRNPKTGKDLTIDARKVVIFKRSVVLKGRLNSAKG
ncbi:MAG TPA: integration host factor subunit alpha [bacterium]|nr:integration host factor subunit alpha [bacterium]HSA33736.1 integration host factor subunit alpha [bacterium]